MKHEGIGLIVWQRLARWNTKMALKALVPLVVCAFISKPNEGTSTLTNVECTPDAYTVIYTLSDNGAFVAYA